MPREEKPSRPRLRASPAPVPRAAPPRPPPTAPGCFQRRRRRFPKRAAGNAAKPWRRRSNVIGSSLGPRRLDCGRDRVAFFGDPASRTSAACRLSFPRSWSAFAPSWPRPKCLPVPSFMAAFLADRSVAWNGTWRRIGHAPAHPRGLRRMSGHSSRWRRGSASCLPYVRAECVRQCRPLALVSTVFFRCSERCRPFRSAADQMSPAALAKPYLPCRRFSMTS